MIDVQEMALNDGHHAAVLLIYKYDVAGVSYECSQDVTYLRQWINLHSCRLGLPTSVKYDPHNPGNSLVVSESWMGLQCSGQWAVSRKILRLRTAAEFQIFKSDNRPETILVERCSGSRPSSMAHVRLRAQGCVRMLLKFRTQLVNFRC